MRRKIRRDGASSVLGIQAAVLLCAEQHAHAPARTHARTQRKDGLPRGKWSCSFVVLSDGSFFCCLRGFEQLSSCFSI